jgi:uncharacterized damage-inducible protein DinB
LDVHDIRTLYDYLYWSHDRMMESVYTLSPEEYLRELGGSHRSIRDALVHLMGAEWIWLSRWHGISPAALLDPAGFPSLEALEDRWARIHKELQLFLGQVRDQDLRRPMVYHNTRGEEITLPLVCSMQHLVNHNTYHRGQVASMLRQLGRTPLGTDLFLFYIESDALAEGMPRWRQLPIVAKHDSTDHSAEE